MTGEDDRATLEEYTVVLFYRYAHIADPQEFVMFLESLCSNSKGTLLGRILVAEEGLNGTLAAFEREHLETLIHDIATKYPQFSKVDWKYSIGQGTVLPFSDLHIRCAKKLLGSGLKGRCVDEMISFSEHSYGGLSEKCTGRHLSPKDFHESLMVDSQNEKTPIIIDVRNKFEYAIGHFQSARSLDTNTYSESFDALQKLLLDDLKADKKVPIYMYCTGGIRCEKASVFVKSKGFENVYQLTGGIHRYLEDIRAEDSLFQGKNFVFDSRISLFQHDNGVNPSCRHPIHEKDEIESHCVHVDNNTKIVGRCIECEVPHDSFSGLVVCTVCRVPVLVCSTCVEKLVEFHCESHQQLKHIYFSMLNRFSVDELVVQRNVLRQMEIDLLSSKRGAKNRRRTLRRQVAKIEEAIAKARNGSDLCQNASQSRDESSSYEDNDSDRKKNVSLLSRNPKTLMNKAGFFWTS